MPKFKIPRSKKLDFFYFIVLTILVLIIFAYIIINTYYDFWKRTYKMEQYYKSQASQQL